MKCYEHGSLSDFLRKNPTIDEINSTNTYCLWNEISLRSKQIILYTVSEFNDIY